MKILNEKNKDIDVKVKEQKKRWGSCTSKDELLFNWRCAMAPAYIIDYIVFSLRVNDMKNILVYGFLVVAKYIIFVYHMIINEYDNIRSEEIGFNTGDESII